MITPSNFQNLLSGFYSDIEIHGVLCTNDGIARACITACEQAGNGMSATDVLVNNGKIDVLVYELPPVVVTKDNAKEVFANDPGRMALLVD